MSRELKPKKLEEGGGRRARFQQLDGVTLQAIMNQHTRARETFRLHIAKPMVV